MFERVKFCSCCVKIEDQYGHNTVFVFCFSCFVIVRQKGKDDEQTHDGVLALPSGIQFSHLHVKWDKERCLIRQESKV